MKEAENYVRVFGADLIKEIYPYNDAYSVGNMHKGSCCASGTLVSGML
jgi:hypothetical protein